MFELNGDGATAPGGDKRGFWQIFNSVVAAFHINIWVCLFNNLQRHLLLKDDDEIHCLQRGEHGGTIGFGVDGAIISFAEHLDGGIGIDGHNQTLSQFARLCKIGDVTAMKNVENAVGHDDRFGKFFKGDNFVFKSRGGQSKSHDNTKKDG